MNSVTVQLIELSAITAGNNDRTKFKVMEIEQLADNIAANGLAQPITLREQSDGYQIVAGERRFRAFNLLVERDASRWSRIPAIIREYTDEETDAIMLAENLHRADLDPIDEANAYQKRIDKYGWLVSECATHANVGEGRVRDRLKLLKLIPEVQHLVRHGNFPLKHAQAMGVLDKNFQFIALRAMRGRNLAFEKFQMVVSGLLEQQAQNTLWDMSLFEKQTDEQIADQFTEIETVTSVFSMTVNGGTIYVMVQHEKGKTVTLDERAVREAVHIE